MVLWGGSDGIHLMVDVQTVGSVSQVERPHLGLVSGGEQDEDGRPSEAG